MSYRLRELIRNRCPDHLLHFYSCPQGGKGGSPPPAPDYTGAAVAQSDASKEIATQQTWANRPDQYTPWGSTTWGAQSAIDPTTGQPITKWTQQEQLNPQLQSALDQQLQQQGDRTNLAGSFMGRVAEDYQKPFDWTNLPQLAATPQAQMTGTYGMQGYVPTSTETTNAPAFADERRRIEDSMFQRMRPEHDRQEANTRTMLANSGLTPGSQAYNQELERLSRTQADERFNAMMTGGTEQQRMNQQLLAQQQQAFGQDIGQGQFYNQAAQGMFSQDAASSAQNFQQQQAMAEYQNKLRQQALSEQQMQRGMSLNEYNALMTGQQVSSPNMPNFQSASGGQAADMMGAMKGTYQSGLDAYNAQQQQSQSQMQGIYSLGGAAIGAIAL